MNSFVKITLCGALMFSALFAFNNINQAQMTYSQRGSTGREVEAIQRTLKEYGLFHGEVTGYYGEQTERAVRSFQQYHRMNVTGIADQSTLRKLNISIGSAPSATESNVNLLARIISAEGRGEIYEGQVAIGAVIMNRIQHPSFPDTLAGVIYQPGAFTAITDGQFDQPVSQTSYSAARDALAGWDPSGGAIYYYNPAKTSDAFIYTRPIIKTIGAHRFCS
ncbi:MAG: spore cortex-lytic enzyme [Oscillospiraceae bacterium]|nr:spore cortex-lytic enzyme [Oscillospiraceae bacterium]